MVCKALIELLMTSIIINLSAICFWQQKTQMQLNALDYHYNGNYFKEHQSKTTNHTFTNSILNQCKWHLCKLDVWDYNTIFYTVGARLARTSEKFFLFLREAYYPPRAGNQIKEHLKLWHGKRASQAAKVNRGFLMNTALYERRDTI